jgi:hypothetical protein
MSSQRVECGPAFIHDSVGPIAFLIALLLAFQISGSRRPWPFAAHAVVSAHADQLGGLLNFYAA